MEHQTNFATAKYGRITEIGTATNREVITENG
jgi:hypothetical protein